MEQAGVTVLFEKVGLTSIPGSATESLVQGWMSEEPGEGGVTGATQCRCVGNAWCQLDGMVWGWETGLMAKGNSTGLRDCL